MPVLLRKRSHMAKYLEIPLDDIVRDPKQPRTEFQTLEDLRPEQVQQIRAEGVSTPLTPDDHFINSIWAHGVLQPIVVRQGDGGKFIIVAGERRWRTSKVLGLKVIPALVIDDTQVQDDSGKLDEASILFLGLAENLQRSDLSDMEVGNSLKRLRLEFNFNQIDLAKRIGKSTATVSKLLKLVSGDSEADIPVCKPSKDGKGISNTLSEFQQLPHSLKSALARLHDKTGIQVSEHDIDKVKAFSKAGNSVAVLEANIDSVLSTTKATLDDRARDFQRLPDPIKEVLQSVQEKTGHVFSELDYRKVSAFTQSGKQLTDMNTLDVLATDLETLEAAARQPSAAGSHAQTAPSGAGVISPVSKAAKYPEINLDESMAGMKAAMASQGALPEVPTPEPDYAAFGPSPVVDGTVPDLEIKNLKLSGHQVSTLLRLLGVKGVHPALAHGRLLDALRDLH